MNKLTLVIVVSLQSLAYVFVHVESRKSMFSCEHVSAVDRRWFRRLLHSCSTQNFLIVDFIAPSRRAAEKAFCVVIRIDFGMNAILANSRYSLIHSSIVIRNLPSMIAMILCCHSVSRHGAVIEQITQEHHPPVPVPPIKSKCSYGRGTWRRPFLSRILSIIFSRIRRLERPRTPPPSQ